MVVPGKVVLPHGSDGAGHEFHRPAGAQGDEETARRGGQTADIHFGDGLEEGPDESTTTRARRGGGARARPAASFTVAETLGAARVQNRQSGHS
jgi:hypothetical protein